MLGCNPSFNNLSSSPGAETRVSVRKTVLKRKRFVSVKTQIRKHLMNPWLYVFYSKVRPSFPLTVL